MAVFELSRAYSAIAIAREARAGKQLPLYMAGIVAGAAMGIGLAFGIPYGGPAVAGAPAAPSALIVPSAGEAAGDSVEPLNAAAVAALTTELSQDLLADLAFPPAPLQVAAPAPAPEAAPAARAVAPVAPSRPTAAPAAAPPVATPAVAPARPNFYVPSASAGPITDLEQRLLAGINAERASAGLAPYTFDSGLSRIARVRVRQMVDQNYFGHTDPFGYTMYRELLAHFGYATYAWAGENLALNNYAPGESAEHAVAALMRSPTHKANILAGEFSRIGVGEFTAPDGRHFYAMIFLG